MSCLAVERPSDGVAVVTMDDPDRRNAMTVEMGAAIRDTFTDLAEDNLLRAVVLTGSPPAFSAGGDLDMLESLARRTRDDGFDATDHMREFYARFLAVRDLPVPVIAAINGHAVGAGLCVALACDLRIVAEAARVGLNFARLGLHPGMGGTWLLPRAVGQQRAAELLYTGRLISGRTAEGYGLALEALPADSVLDRALALANDIAASAPQVVRQIKRNLRDVLQVDLATQLAREAADQAVNYASDDLREGLAAVRERRLPSFSGS